MVYTSRAQKNRIEVLLNHPQNYLGCSLKTQLLDQHKITETEPLKIRLKIHILTSTDSCSNPCHFLETWNSKDPCYTGCALPKTCNIRKVTSLCILDVPIVRTRLILIPNVSIDGFILLRKLDSPTQSPDCFKSNILITFLGALIHIITLPGR